MKRIFASFAIGLVLSLQMGCSANTSVGNRDQHGAGITAKTRGAEKGVRAKVY